MRIGVKLYVDYMFKFLALWVKKSLSWWKNYGESWCKGCQAEWGKACQDWIVWWKDRGFRDVSAWCKGQSYRLRKMCQFAWDDICGMSLQILPTIGVIAGICFPILLLIGLKHGLVKKFQEDIEKSPTATRIVLYPTMKTSGFKLQEIEILKNQYPGQIVYVYPIVNHSMTIQREKDMPRFSVTVNPTFENDPFLKKSYKIDVGEAIREQYEKLQSRIAISWEDFQLRSLIITASLAEKLQARPQEPGKIGESVKPGDTATIYVVRNQGKEGNVEYPLRIFIVAVLEEEKENDVGYALTPMLNNIELYKQGEPVKNFGWPGFPREIVADYKEYLCFSRRALSSNERLRLAGMGLTIQEVEKTDPRHNLCGLLKDDPNLLVYSLVSGVQDEKSLGEKIADFMKVSSFLPSDAKNKKNFSYFDLDVGRVESYLESSDSILLPWSEPVVASVENTKHCLLGISMNGRWLRKHFKNKSMFFPHSSSGLQAKGFSDLPVAQLRYSGLSLPLQYQKIAVADEKKMAKLAGDHISLLAGRLSGANVDMFALGRMAREITIMATQPQAMCQNPTWNGLPLAVVPSKLLAHLRMAVRKVAVFDPDYNMFRAARLEVSYYQICIYAGTIFDVVSLTDSLSKSFKCLSQDERVREMKNYSITLGTMTNLVAFFTFLFGCLVVFMIFGDAAERKKETIGILRMMGCSKADVFTVHFFQSILIIVSGTVVCFVCIIVCYLLINLLMGKDTCILAWQESLRICTYLVVSCIVGTLYPTVQSCRRDPLETIEKGKYA